MFFDIYSLGGSVFLEANEQGNKQTIIETDGDQSVFLLDTRTGLLYEDKNKESFFKGKVTKQAVRYMLKPGGSVTFSNTGGSVVTITGHRRDYI